MKHLIVGAGATFAEALALGNPTEKCPPLIRDFARKTWENYTPHPYLEEYDKIYIDMNCVDISGYPVCTEEFFNAYKSMAVIANTTNSFLAPLLNWRKTRFLAK